MTDRKALARKALAQAAVLKLLREEHDKTRAQLVELFTDPGEREVGTLQDHRLGTAALEKGRETWTVVDEANFLEWVAVHYPAEIVSTVRSSAREAILQACKRDGGVVLDEVTGEVGSPPGVAVRKAPPTLVVRPEKHAGWVVAQWLGDAAEQLGIEATQ